MNWHKATVMIHKINIYTCSSTKHVSIKFYELWTHVREETEDKVPLCIILQHTSSHKNL